MIGLAESIRFKTVELTEISDPGTSVVCISLPCVGYVVATACQVVRISYLETAERDFDKASAVV